MCKVFNISKSGYYAWLHRKPIGRTLRNQQLLEAIKKVFHTSKGRYDSPRITQKLQMQSIEVSRILVAKIMRQHHLKSILKKKYNLTTDSKLKYWVADNVFNRTITTEKTNTAWVSDITYIGTAQGWLYLTTVIDLFDRKVIGWSLSYTMTAKETSVAAFRMAVNQRVVGSSPTGRA